MEQVVCWVCVCWLHVCVYVCIMCACALVVCGCMCVRVRVFVCIIYLREREIAAVEIHTELDFSVWTLDLDGRVFEICARRLLNA